MHVLLCFKQAVHHDMNDFLTAVQLLVFHFLQLLVRKKKRLFQKFQKFQRGAYWRPLSIHLRTKYHPFGIADWLVFLFHFLTLRLIPHLSGELLCDALLGHQRVHRFAQPRVQRHQIFCWPDQRCANSRGGERTLSDYSVNAWSIKG